MQKKFIDRGNKRRFVKNVLRFVKNPLGYTYWKTYKLRMPKGRIITSLLAFMVIGGLWKYKNASCIS